MRLFIALDIAPAIRHQIANFMDGVRGFAPDARWVRPESLHVTLKFIGEKTPGETAAIQKALTNVKGSSLSLTFRGYGFFPAPRSARVFWVGIESGPELLGLARQVDHATEKLGIPREIHDFSPHLTLARGASGSGAPGWHKGDRSNTQFSKLQEKLAKLPPPDFGTMAARELFLYQSKLSPGGAQYTKIAGFQLTP